MTPNSALPVHVHQHLAIGHVLSGQSSSSSVLSAGALPEPQETVRVSQVSGGNRLNARLWSVDGGPPVRDAAFSRWRWSSFPSNPVLHFERLMGSSHGLPWHSPMSLVRPWMRPSSPSRRRFCKLSCYLRYLTRHVRPCRVLTAAAVPRAQRWTWTPRCSTWRAAYDHTHRACPFPSSSLSGMSHKQCAAKATPLQGEPKLRSDADAALKLPLGCDNHTKLSSGPLYARRHDPDCESRYSDPFWKLKHIYS